MAKSKIQPYISIIFNTEPEVPADRSIGLLKRPANKMFARRFRAADVRDWQRAAAKLGMSDTEFVERVLNATTLTIFSMGKSQ